MTQDSEILSLSDATALLSAALEASGAAPFVALSVAKALVAAQAEGQAGHGFSRLADYTAQVASGKVNGTAKPALHRHGTASITIDAANGFAYPALDLAIEEGTKAAQDSGSCAMSITRSHHCGALSVQVEKIAQAGCVGLMVANSPPAIAPWGAKTPVFGTNPIAFAGPRTDGAPLVIDLSLSVVARGKVMNAKKLGQPIPEGWALDPDGAPTTDPNAALAGSMVPIGDAKGTALALIVETLAAAFTGANTSTNVSSYFSADGPPPGSGQFLLALRPPDVAGFTARLDAILGMIEGLDGARLPGTRRAQALAQAQTNGIEVPKTYLDGARRLAAGSHLK